MISKHESADTDTHTYTDRVIVMQFLYSSGPPSSLCYSESTVLALHWTISGRRKNRKLMQRYGMEICPDGAFLTLSTLKNNKAFQKKKKKKDSGQMLT